MNFIDTHTHLDGEEFKNDLPRGCHSCQGYESVATCDRYEIYRWHNWKYVPAISLILHIRMIGLHPEEVKGTIKLC